MPEPDPDARPLERALHEAGLRAEWLAWDDPAQDFSRARLTLLRSTWNYPARPQQFADWAVDTSRVSALWNPLAVVRWNLHKRYLLDLERRGLAVTPTALLPRGSSRTLRAVAGERGWSDVVVKPAISAASLETIRVRPGDEEAGERHLRRLAAERDVLVQRYLPAVEHHGEHALVWVDGALTHAVRKSPRFAAESESVSPVGSIPPAERELAERAIAAVDPAPLYARIDVAPGPDGVPLLMELELIEPSLFFAHGAQALERLVAGLRRRIG